MLRNLPENYFYDDLPKFIVDLDQRKLIQAVVGGFQDRVADLRSTAGWFENLNSPQPAPLTCVFATYVGDAGNLITRTLDVLPDTPSDPVALVAWAAAQMEVDAARVTSVTVGTDLLRQVGVDTVQLLARSLGATLYAGPAGELEADAIARRERAMATYFPRLKTKGVARSFATVAKLAGFDDAAMTPLWGRLSPRVANDVGAAANAPDFVARPDYVPSERLPDLTGDYDPQDFTDGAFYQYASPPLSLDPASDSFYTSAVGDSPFFRLVQVAGTVAHPLAGTYSLAGGAPELTASVLLDSGTVLSGLMAQALVPGSSFNGLPIVVTGNGTTRTISAFGPLSSLKYRTSYFDVGAYVLSPGTISVTPNADLEANPDLVPPAGVAPAPWRPWSGGSQPAPTVTLWPEKVEVSGTVAPTPLVQAPAGMPQVDVDTMQGDATRVFGYVEEVRAATRFPRRKVFGPLARDPATFAPYPQYYDLGFGAGTFAGTLASPQAPYGDYTASFAVLVGGVPFEISSEAVTPTLYRFGGSVSGGVVTGEYDFVSGTYVAVMEAGFSGTLRAEWLVTDTGTIRPEPLSGQPRSYEARPETEVSMDGWNLATEDDYPWRRLMRAGGEVVAPDYFRPFGGDPSPTTVGQEARVVDDAGVAWGLRVLDLDNSRTPFRVRVVPLEGDDASMPTRPCLGVKEAVGLAEVRLVSEELLVAASCWVPARFDDLTAWWPLTEHPDSALAVHDATAYPDPVAPWLRPSHRVWAPFRGWGLSLPVGVNVGSTADRAVGDELTGGIYLQQGVLQPNPETFAQWGPVLLGIGTDGFVATAGQADGVSSVSTAFIPFSGTQAYVFASLTKSLLSLGAGSPYASPTVVSSAGTFAPGSDTHVTLFGAQGVSYVQDFSLWAATRGADDLAPVRNPQVLALSTGETLPWVASVRGDRYSLEILDSGFVVTSAGTTAGTRPTPEWPYQGYVERYAGDGQFVGDERFKLVGLGGAQVVPARIPLGIQGPEVEGWGRVVLAGTTGDLPGFTPVWQGTLTGMPPLTNFNAAEDRAYILADNGTTVYRVGIDDLGSGPEFTVSLPLRHRPAAEMVSFVNPALEGFEQPTDAVSLLASPLHRLSVAGNGTTGTVYEAAWAGSMDTPPLYLYNQSQVRSSQANAFTAWLNPNAFGQGLGVAALQSNGQMSFEVADGLPAGFYRIAVDAGNVGTVDDAFAGFDVEFSLQGSAGPATVFTATLLPTGAGASPRGLTLIEFTLATALSAPWVLEIDWTNDRDVPSRGQVRQLAVFGFEIRRLAPVLYQVTLDPLAITSVGTVVFVPTALPAGAWVGALNSFGTIATYTHESVAYSTTLGLDAYNDNRQPLSNGLTGSTLGRVEDLQVLNPLALPDAAPPTAPTLSGLTVSPLGALSQGEDVVFSVTATGTNLGYVWNLWSSGTVATRVPQVATTLSQGGNLEVVVTAVDDLGQVGVASATFPVQGAPSLQLLLATVNNQPLPYVTDLMAFAADPGALPLAYSWASGGTVVGSTGTVVGYPVTAQQDLVLTVTNSAGLSAVGTLPLYGSPNRGPTVSIADFPASARSQVPLSQTLDFAAVVGDPDGRGIASVIFSFWDSTTITATLTPMPGFGATYYATAVKMVPSIAAPGPGLFSVTATDADGFTGSASGIVILEANAAPVIQYAQPVNPGVAAGQIASFEALAIDLQGDTIDYRWDFTSIGVTLYGANVDVDTTGLSVGTIISGLLTVSDNFGAEAQATFTGCAIYGSRLQPIGLSVGSGNYTQGLSVVITSPDSNVAIRFTLDGTDPADISSGSAYGGAVNIPYVAGKTVQLHARSFLTGSAPSPLASASYTFI